MLSIKNVIHFSSYLVYLLPLALLTGSFLPDLFVSILSLIFIYIIFKEKEFTYVKNTFSIFFIIFYFYINLNSLLSDHAIFSLKSSLVYIRFGLLSVFVWYLIDKQEKFLNNFFLYLTIAFLICLASAIYQLIFFENLVGDIKPENRLILLFSDRAVLGQYLARMFPLLFSLIVLLIGSRIKYFIYIFLIFIFTDIIIYLSGERTAFVLMIVSSLFVLIFMKKFKLFRLSTILLSLLMIIVITFYLPNVKERNIDLTISQLGINEKNDRLNFFSPTHESHAITGIKMFSHNKLIGIGPNNFRKLCSNEKYIYDKKSCSTHPHHILIQIGSEIGLIGLLFFFTLILYLTIIIFKHIKTLFSKNKNYLSDYQVCLVSCFVCTLFPLVPSLNFFNGWMSIIYFLPVGFYLQSISKNKNII